MGSDSEPAAEHFAAFARRLGVARSTVTRAAQAGRLVLDGAGLILVTASLERWHASQGSRTDLTQRHAEHRGAPIPSAAPEKAPSGPKNPLAAPPESPSTSEGPSDATTGASRAQQQAIALHWQNALLDLQNQVQEGRQLPLGDLLAELQGLGAALRGAVDRLVDQIAPRLAVASTPQERSLIVQRELAQVRKHLRREFPRALRRLTQTATGTAAAQEGTP